MVTGATGGLGSALVRRLADQGARLVLTSRSMNALQELISELSESNLAESGPTESSGSESGRAVAVTADLSRPGEAEVLAQKALHEVYYIDVLINSAGIGYFALMEEATEENIRHLFELNTFSPLALTKALVPHMKRRGGGRIINIVSCAGRIPIPTVGVYGGSKSALAVMSNTMRLELEPSGIDIINIYPGTVDDSFEENALREEDRPGLCPTEHCGLPRYEIADKVLEAAAGPPGEIWLERPGKWLSLAAIALPRYVDKRLSPVRDRVVTTRSLKKRRWLLLQVESALACNLRCVMCPWKEIRKRAENKGLMTQEVWDAIRPHLPQAETVDFTGGGEPLLQPRLAEWIADAKSAGCRTGILTNGLLLKKDVAAALIHAGLDMICISMDGATAEVYNSIRIGSNFDRVCENVMGLSGMRMGSVPMISINFVIMDLNFHQMEEMVRLASRLGVDQVNFKQCDVIRGEHGKAHGLFGSGETRKIRRLKKALAGARGLAKKLKIKTTAFSFTPEELPVCEQDPRNSMFIRYDGTVGPCINLAIGGPTTFLGEEVLMPVVRYGSVIDRDLEDLWESETCRYYRDTFHGRVTAHEEAVIQSLVGSSAAGRERTLREAREAMPDAPEGCRVCHYLYDI